MGQFDQHCAERRRHIEHGIVAERFQHRDLVAALKFGAAQAVFPSLQRKRAAIDLDETQLIEEPRNVRESKDRVELMLFSFPFKRFYNQATDALGLTRRLYRQRSDFG